MDKLLETIGALQEKRSTGSGGIVLTVVLLVLTIVGIAALAYTSWRNGKELSKLRHDRDVAKEEARREAVAGASAELVEEQQLHFEAANIALDRADDLRERIISRAEEHARTKVVLSKLKTWEDINEYLASKRASTVQ